MTEQMERIAVCLTSDKKVWYTLLLIAALAVLLAVLVIWSLLAASPEKTVEEDDLLRLLPVGGDARPGGDELADNNVLLQAHQVVHLALDSVLLYDLGGLL